ncbi:MAG: cbb3-type cytochrome c oxidase subunit I, partial [Alcaligenes sp.]
MNPTALLLAAFILSIAGLFAFIWSLRKGLFDADVSGARTIFHKGEIGQPEEPSAGDAQRQALSLAAADHLAENHGQQTSAVEMAAREQADRSSSLPAFLLIVCAVVWLVVASFAGLISSLKLHWPEFLGDVSWLSFGRLRTIHLNGVAYGWAPMGLLGLTIWMLPRLLQTP